MRNTFYRLYLQFTFTMVPLKPGQHKCERNCGFIDLKGVKL